MKLRAFPPILLRELWLRITSNVFGLPSMLRAENSGSNISMLDELPVICVCMLYHTLKGGSLVEALRSVDQLDYPKERLVLMMIDNYSVDGAFEYVRDWLEARREKYMRVVHIRAKGTVPRLRNIGLLTALNMGVKYFSFIESDVIVDKEFLKRLLGVLKEYSGGRMVFSVSAVRDEGFENQDALEKIRIRWLKSRRGASREVTVGEACNSGNCLIDLDRVKDVGFFDEDVLFIEDLDWGRRATRKGYICLFDGRVVIRHLKKYSLKEFRKYFFKGALSESKLFLKNGIAWRAVRSALYWDAVLAALLFSWFSPVPLALVVLLGFVTYFRRCVGLGRLLLYPVLMPFSVAKSVALTAAMLYWVLRGGYKTEKVTVLGEPDWEVVS
jgi:GT2 family glycosyltransferase